MSAPDVDAEYAALAALRPRPVIGADWRTAFAARLQAQGGTCEFLAHAADLPARLLCLTETAAGSVRELHASSDAWLRAQLATEPRLALLPDHARPQGTWAVTMAFAAIAETGSVAVCSGPAAPLALDFLPERLVVVVRSADLVATLDDFWTCVRERFGPVLPRAISLLSGPSTTGDIEMVFATGVHGPVRLVVLMVDGAGAT